MEILTRQENKIASLVASEFAEKEIAQKLFISYKTVHTHTKNIRKKLGAKNNVGIAVRYLLSLETPKAFVPGVICLMAQLFMVFSVQNVELRKTPTAKRIVKIRRYEA